MKTNVKTIDPLFKPAFKLQKSSVRGGAVLKPMPAHWQKLEDAHVTERFLKTQMPASKSKHKA